MMAARSFALTLTCLWAASARADVPHFEFVGNRAVSSQELHGAIALVGQDESIAFDELVRRDLLAVLGAYDDRGYLEARLGAPNIDPAAETVTVAIHEGRLYTVAAVAVTGDLLGDEHDELVRLVTHPGVPVSRVMVSRDCQTLADVYEDQGYAFVNVMPMAKFDVARATADLRFDVTRGPVVRVESIRVSGNRAVTDEQVRRLLAISAGDRFALTPILASKRRLLALPAVKDAVIAVERGSAPDRAVLIIEIAEMPLTNL